MTIASGPRTVVALLGALAAAGPGQSRGAVTGVVSEMMGGVVPGATIGVGANEQRRSVVVGTDGRFRLDNLAPGTYRVEAELSGFRTAIAENVEVRGNRDTECNFLIRVSPTAVVTHTLLDAALKDVLQAADAVVRLRVAQTCGRAS